MSMSPLCPYPIIFYSDFRGDLITALAIDFTSIFSTAIRSFDFLLVISSADVAIQSIIHSISSTLWASVLAGNAATYVLRYLELVLIDKWRFEHGGFTRLEKSPPKRVLKKLHMSADIAVGMTLGLLRLYPILVHLNGWYSSR